jgi:hypothetical protein
MCKKQGRMICKIIKNAGLIRSNLSHDNVLYVTLKSRRRRAPKAERSSCDTLRFGRAASSVLICIGPRHIAG